MKLLDVAAGAVNGAVIAAMVAVGFVGVTEARAEARLATVTAEDRECLAKNIFFEARNQTLEGRVAVAWVTLNRVEDSSFPGSICRVVHQANRDANGNPIRHQCQFSWYCDGKSDRIPNNPIAQRAWEDAQLIADVVLLDWARGRTEHSPVQNAVYYHADYVSPHWARSFTEVVQIDSHIFYERN